MIWPVLLDAYPRDTPWSLGERVVTRLRWLDDPQLPEDEVLHRVVLRTSALLDADGQPWAHLVTAGDLVAVRDGDHRGGEDTFDGCLGFDGYLGIIGYLPATVGIVRRVRVVHDLHDRGTDGWIRRPGHVRLADVPDAAPERLGDGPSVGGSVQLFSPEQYFHAFRDRLPAEQWQARGFLVNLEVAGPV